MAKAIEVEAGPYTEMFARRNRLNLSMHRAPYLRAAPSVRFWARVDKSADCWLWTGARLWNGYGRFRLRAGKCKMTHRMAYELTHGPIPDGLFVCHSCDNPPCVNPAHLFLGTQRDNMLDAARKHRTVHPNATKTTCKHGHVFSPENTKITKVGKRRCRACDRERSAAQRSGARAVA